MKLNVSSLTPEQQKKAVESKAATLNLSSSEGSNQAPGATGGQIAAAAQGVNEIAQASGMAEDSTAGGAISGASSGAALGASVGGPWGAAIGGVIGGVAGGLSARNKRKAANAKIDAQVERDKAVIESNRGLQSNAILRGLASNLSNTLLR